MPAEIRFRRRLVRAMAFCNLQSEDKAQTELLAAGQERPANPQDDIQLQLAGARCDQALGNFSKAYDEFAAIQRSSTQDGFAKLYALLGMGSCSVRQHHYEDALRWYLLSQVAATALKAVPYEQVAQGNLGFLYLELGDVEQALTNSKAAVDLTTHGGADTYLESWLLNLGRVYHNTGQSGLAKESYERALKLATSRGNDLVAARCLHNLVQFEVLKGNIAQASEYHNQAKRLHLSQEIDLRDLRIDSAYLLAANGEYSVAEPELLQLISEVRDTPRLEWSLEAELARVYAKQGRRNLADLWFRKGISTMEEASANMKQAPFAIAMLDSWPIFDDYIAFLYEQKQPEHALQVAQLARARNLAEQLGVKPHKEGPRAWVGRIEAMLRSRHSVLLAYYEAEHETYAWIVTGKGLKMTALGVDQNDLETLADQYWAEIDQHYPIDSSPTQQKLYQILIKPFQ
ncbi:MAG: tetratricopeptide repeat protein, partial [Actinomycetota bacterium]